MSIYFSGTFKRSGGIVSAIGKQLKYVNLKPVKRIQVQVDPFHANAVAVRDFVYYVSSPRITSTNLSCALKTIVVCDRSEPRITVDLQDSRQITFRSGNLNVLELLKLYNKHVSSLVKPEEGATTGQQLTQKQKRKSLK